MDGAREQKIASCFSFHSISARRPRAAVLWKYSDVEFVSEVIVRLRIGAVAFIPNSVVPLWVDSVVVVVWCCHCSVLRSDCCGSSFGTGSYVVSGGKWYRPGSSSNRRSVAYPYESRSRGSSHM